MLSYAIENAAAIEQDMNKASALNKAERRRQKQQGVPHRRREPLLRASHQVFGLPSRHECQLCMHGWIRFGGRGGGRTGGVRSQ